MRCREGEGSRGIRSANVAISKISLLDSQGQRHTNRLSGVSSTVTPASTLPTVSETSIVVDFAGNLAALRLLMLGYPLGRLLGYGSSGSCREVDVWVLHGLWLGEHAPWPPKISLHF